MTIPNNNFSFSKQADYHQYANHTAQNQSKVVIRVRTDEFRGRKTQRLPLANQKSLLQKKPFILTKSRIFDGRQELISKMQFLKGSLSL